MWYELGGTKYILNFYNKIEISNYLSFGSGTSSRSSINSGGEAEGRIHRHSCAQCHSEKAMRCAAERSKSTTRLTIRAGEGDDSKQLLIERSIAHQIEKKRASMQRMNTALDVRLIVLIKMEDLDLISVMRAGDAIPNLAPDLISFRGCAKI